jgi:hypothetical protein
MLPRLFMAVGDFRASSVNACDASMEQLQFSGEEHGKKKLYATATAPTG